MKLPAMYFSKIKKKVKTFWSIHRLITRKVGDILRDVLIGLFGIFGSRNLSEETTFNAFLYFPFLLSLFQGADLAREANHLLLKHISWSPWSVKLAASEV